MIVDSGPLLEGDRIFHSRHFEEARAFLGSKNFEFELRGAAAEPPLDLRINGVYMPNVYVGFIAYGAPAEISSTPARTDHWLQWPVRGRIDAALGREVVSCSETRAAVISPTDIHRTRLSAGAARINISFAEGVLARHLGTLLGEEVRQPLAFTPALDLSAGYGRTLADAIGMALSALERADSAFRKPLVMTRFEQFVMTQLLLEQPHNYRDALQRPCPAISPRDVKRAIDYIHAHLAQPITIADLVGASGVAGRTLFKHFRDFKGVSPMGYVRRARLERARADLMRASPDESVTAIATRWGFDHMGRFAIEYRRAFGESPSRTKGKGPGRLG